MNALASAILDTAIDAADFVLGGNALESVSSMCLFTFFALGFLCAADVPNMHSNAHRQSIGIGACAMYAAVVLMREALGTCDDPRLAGVAVMSDFLSRFVVGALAGLATVLLRLLFRLVLSS